MELLKANKGFTLIELLVVVGLMGLVMVSTVGLLLAVLRASRKNEDLTAIRQQGDHVLGTISGMIRSAKTIPGTCGSGESLDIEAYDGFTTTISCDLTEDKISSSSSGAGTDVDLLTGSETGISLESCSFVCTQPEGDAPYSITTQFSLSKGTGISQSEATFQTTTSLRSY